MNEDIPTPNSEYVKPCRVCGAQERYKADGKCKPCVRARASKWQKVNPDRAAERGRKWREANPDRVTETNRNWKKANPGRKAESNRRWAEANPDKVAESNRKWQKANPDKVAENGRKWAEANPEKMLKKTRKWQKANPDKVRAIVQNRRAKKKGNGGKLSKDIAQRLLILQKGKCACGCGASLKKTGHHLDHIMPISLGGKNTDDNIQLLTPKCNLRKSAKHPDDWARENGRLI